jgi:Mg2+-importing ATPase
MITDSKIIPTGISDAEAAARLKKNGPNAVRSHHVRGVAVFFRQLRSPVLVLLGSTAIVSFLLGERINSLVILGILVLSVLLGFFTEYRAERATELLHSRVEHKVVVTRSGRQLTVPVTELVVGDVVSVNLGTVIPADLKVISAAELECDESIITGESLSVEKIPAKTDSETEPQNLLLMGTVVSAGSGIGEVIGIAADTEFGRIALSLGDRQPETVFQMGLRKFSLFLVWISLILTTVIFVVNTILNRPIIESVLFSLAIAIGMTPQLLPAVVSSALAIGSKKLAKAGVLVKRLVSIEDLGDIDILITDKTGTLTTGEISFTSAFSATGKDAFGTAILAIDTDFARAGSDTSGLNSIDAALWMAAEAKPNVAATAKRIAAIPFSHETRIYSALVEAGDGVKRIVAKGSAEDLAKNCKSIPKEIKERLEVEYKIGSRVLLVASKPTNLNEFTPADVTNLTVDGLVVFADELKANAKASIDRLNSLGVEVKIATGDSMTVAMAVCEKLEISTKAVLTGIEIDTLTDFALSKRAEESSVFARVSPEQKSRIIIALRKNGNAVGFLGDGVNDAIALHDADVGISVDSATDVAKDAADIVLLSKDLGILADGVLQGRRVFNNTMKYVFMGTSSDFGNMFSAAFGSIGLGFLPMTPGQVLLNDVLYDSSQLAIPYDHSDKEAVQRPSHWNVGMIRRFMLIFGPISSLFDFATFAMMLTIFHAGVSEFQSGWFVESLATETLIVFVIRTRRVPFFRSRPAVGLVASVLVIVAIGCALPYSPVAGYFGFVPLPAPFFVALLGMILIYLVLVETAKHYFFKTAFSSKQPNKTNRQRSRNHRLARRAARFSVPGSLR